MNCHPGRRRGATPREESCTVSTADLPPRCRQNGQLVGGRTSIRFHRLLAPRFKEGDHSPMSSRVGSLHGGPDSRCLHSEKFIFDSDHTSKWFRRVFAQWQKQRGGRSFQPRAAATAVSTTGLLPMVSTTGVFPSCVSRAGGTGYGPIPTKTHIEIKHDCLHRYVLIVHCLPGRRLDGGQTHFRLVIINRHVFILRIHTPPIHDRHAPDCLHNQRLFLLVFLPCFIGLSTPATGRCLPGKEDKTKQDYMHRYLSSRIACPPGVFATENSFLLRICLLYTSPSPRD